MTVLMRSTSTLTPPLMSSASRSLPVSRPWTTGKRMAQAPWRSLLEHEPPQTPPQQRPKPPRQPTPPTTPSSPPTPQGSAPPPTLLTPLATTLQQQPVETPSSLQGSQSLLDGQSPPNRSSPSLHTKGSASRQMRKVSVSTQALRQHGPPANTALS